MARSPGRSTLTSLEYRNPLTGGPALATLGCLLEGLPVGARTRPRRETASSVIVVARGTGTLTCGGQTFPLGRSPQTQSVQVRAGRNRSPRRR